MQSFGLWTVNKKSEECVTLHSDKGVAPLPLNDVNNFLIPPRSSIFTFYLLLLLLKKAESSESLRHLYLKS